MNTPASKSSLQAARTSSSSTLRWVKALIGQTGVNVWMLLRDRKILAWVIERQRGLFQTYLPPAARNGALNLIRDGSLVGVYASIATAQVRACEAIGVNPVGVDR